MRWVTWACRRGAAEERNSDSEGQECKLSRRFAGRGAERQKFTVVVPDRSLSGRPYRRGVRNSEGCESAHAAPESLA